MRLAGYEGPAGFLHYTPDPENVHFAENFLREMDKNRSLVPTDQLITLENIDDGVVCNVCAGHKANEALGRVLSVLISARYGTTVGLELDAYRILLRLPFDIRAADVQDLLLSLDPAHMPGIIRLALKRTALFKWKLVQIAKKFGAIDPDADYEKISIQRLLEYFENTDCAAGSLPGTSHRVHGHRYSIVYCATDKVGGDQSCAWPAFPDRCRWITFFTGPDPTPDARTRRSFQHSGAGWTRMTFSCAA